MFRIRPCHFAACAIAWLIWLAVPASAADDVGILTEHLVRSWSGQDGLPSGPVRAIASDQEGYLWLGTDRGLVRFDGNRFVLWRPRNLPQSSTLPVLSLLSARDGSLWVGFGDTAGVGRVRHGELELYGREKGLEARLGAALLLLEDHAGTIWAGTPRGLFRFTGDGWERLSPVESPVFALYEDGKHRLWIATSTTVYRRSADGPFVPTDLDAPSNLWVGADFSEDAAGTLWMTHSTRGFQRLAGAASAVRSSAAGWGARLLHDQRRNLWIATLGQGLWVVRQAGSRGEPDVEVLDTRQGLLSNTVYAVSEDADGNIWVGTSAGLMRFAPRKVRSITDIGAPTVVAASKEGVWVGTTAGLVRFSASGRRRYGEADGLPSEVIRNLHVDQDGVLWVATNRGLVRFVDGRFRPVGIPQRDQRERTYGMANAPDGVWLADRERGLFRYHAGRLEGLYGDHIGRALLQLRPESLCVDRHGVLWFIHGPDAIGTVDAHRTLRTIPVDVGAISTLYADSDGVLWVGGRTGLGRVVNGRVTTLGSASGFPAGVRSIIGDGPGPLWIGTDSGIVRLERGEFDKAVTDRTHRIRYRLLNDADGVAGTPKTGSAPIAGAAQAPDGRLWFITSNGVTVLDPANIGEAPALARVHVEQVVADGVSFDHRGPISLSPNTRHLRVLVAAPNLTDPARVQFRYRVDGFNREWIDGGQVREISLINLPPRRYRLRIAVSNSDGVWGKESTLDFTLRHALYQTRWFKGLLAVGAGFVMLAGWQFRARQIRRQFALVLTERVRMGRAIHDTLLQGLVGLALQCDDIAHAEEGVSQQVKHRLITMRRQIEHFVNEARYSIFDLRSPIIEGRDLGETLRLVADRAVAGRSVQVDVVEAGTIGGLTSSVREELVLIAQEAVRNAVRHGNAAHVRIEVLHERDHVRLRIVDDGGGFDEERISKSEKHFGLASMRERAQRIHGQVTVLSSPGNGTTIEAVLPVPRLVS